MSKRKLYSLLLCLSLIISLFTGCGGSDSALSAQSDSNSVGFSVSESSEAPSLESVPSADPTNRSNTKLIYTASLSAETTDFPKVLSEVESLVETLQGYNEHSNLSGQIGSRSISYTLRIPQNQYDSFIKQVGTLCTITHKNEDLQDISEEYFDRENRLKAQKIKQERLLSLLEKATKMEDIITLESALAEVQSEIDTLTGTLNKYDSLVNFSTIDLSINEVQTLSTMPETISFVSDIKRAFTDGTYGFIHFVRGILIILVGVWPFVLIVCIMLVLARIRVRKSKKKQPKNDWTDFYSPNTSETTPQENQTLEGTSAEDETDSASPPK